MGDATRVKVNTPGPARDQQRLVLRDKPRDAASMEGWRIEVDYYLADLESGETFWLERANGEEAQLIAREFILSPKCVPPGDTVDCDVAAADPLFETIYVSRELTGDEPDTLRRLMAEEVARERGEAKLRDSLREASGSVVGFAKALGHNVPAWIGPLAEAMTRPSVGVVTDITESDGRPLYTVQIGAPVMTVTDAEREQRKAKMRDALDKLAANPNSVTFAVYDGLRHWSCPKCKVMIGDFAVESRAFKHHCGFDSEAPTAPRVPKVGDEIEVRYDVDQSWHRGEVVELEPGCVRVNGRHGGWYSIEQERDFWRWPEAKR